MIRVAVQRQSGQVIGFQLSGHADAGEHGQDLVCAAVSAITQTAILGLTDVMKLKVAYSVEQDGEAICILPKDMQEDEKSGAALIIETMLAGLRSVQLAYPKTLKFCDREV